MKLADDIELFDDYLNGILDQASKDAFEHRLAVDSSFRSDFEDYKTAVNVIRAAGAGQHVRSIMNDDASRTFRIRYAVRLSVAACLAFAIVFLLWPSDRASNERIFEKNFQPYPSIFASRSGGDSRLDAALEQYAIGDYAKAVELMKDVQVKNDTLYFYSAVANLYLKQSDDAITALSRIDENSVFHQQVTWYLGLAFLLHGERETARSTFAKIRPSEYKYQEAQSIVASL
jgi:hypothetical protein